MNLFASSSSSSASAASPSVDETDDATYSTVFRTFDSSWIAAIRGRHLTQAEFQQQLGPTHADPYKNFEYEAELRRVRSRSRSKSPQQKKNLGSKSTARGGNASTTSPLLRGGIAKPFAATQQQYRAQQTALPASSSGFFFCLFPRKFSAATHLRAARRAEEQRLTEELKRHQARVLSQLKQDEEDAGAGAHMRLVAPSPSSPQTIENSLIQAELLPSRHTNLKQTASLKPAGTSPAASSSSSPLQSPAAPGSSDGGLRLYPQQFSSAELAEFIRSSTQEPGEDAMTSSHQQFQLSHSSRGNSSRPRRPEHRHRRVNSGEINHDHHLSITRRAADILEGYDTPEEQHLDPIQMTDQDALAELELAMDSLYAVGQISYVEREQVVRQRRAELEEKRREEKDARDRGMSTRSSSGSTTGGRNVISVKLSAVGAKSPAKTENDAPDHVNKQTTGSVNAADAEEQDIGAMLLQRWNNAHLFDSDYISEARRQYDRKLVDIILNPNLTAEQARKLVLMDISSQPKQCE